MDNHPLTGERRLAAIMFTDIVDFTRSAQANESLTLQLLEEYRGLLRPVFASHGGTEVKTMGDGFLVEFRSALDAVQCAAELQEKLADRNSGVPDNKKVQVRVGIHLGDVVHGAGDVYGDAVNVASRIEPLAKGGGICISEQVYTSVRNKTEFEFEALGGVELKNVQLPMNVYKIIMPTGRMHEAEGAPRERLAVLPFVNISPDPNDEYFADGLTEELISKLSLAPDLKVIARTSVMNYKKKEKKISDIGRELNVGSIVEGSVRKAGNKIRVTVQLIDARTEEHLWASNYDKDLDDVFAIQSDIASRVAGSVSSGSFFRKPTRDTENVEAYTLYIQGMQQYHEASEGSLRKALALFRDAVSLDPSFVRSHAGLSLVWARLATNGYEQYSVVADMAEPAARRALELDPDSAEAHAAYAGVCWVLDRFDETIKEAETAISLNPNMAEAYNSLSIEYSTMGDMDRAVEAGTKAIELDPLNVNLGNHFAMILNGAGRYKESLAVLTRLGRVHPRNPRVYNRLAELYMMKRDFPQAQEWLTKGLELSPTDPNLRLNQGVLYALTGRKDEAEEMIKEMQFDRTEVVRYFSKLFISAALGNINGAFEALDKLTPMHAWPGLIKTHPLFAEMRKDPRFGAFSGKVGLPLD